MNLCQIQITAAELREALADIPNGAIIVLDEPSGWVAAMEVSVSYNEPVSYDPDEPDKPTACIVVIS